MYHGQKSLNRGECVIPLMIALLKQFGLITHPRSVTINLFGMAPNEQDTSISFLNSKIVTVYVLESQKKHSYA